MRILSFKYLLTIIIVISIISCDVRKQSQQVEDNFSSPKSLFVDHIISYTGGVVSVTSDIRVKFAKPIGDSLVGQPITSSVFKINPKIGGTVYWGDNRTVVFKPERKLNTNETYEVAFNLSEFISDIDDNKKEFKFIFQTLKQNYEFTVKGIYFSDKNNLKNVNIQGQIQTADIVYLGDLKKSISANQSGKNLKIKWQNTNGKNIFNFIINNVARTEEKGEVEITINGSPIGVDKSEDIDVPIPALSDFEIISCNIVRGEDKYISVLFSDPLEEKQNLTGLIQLKNIKNKPRLVINVNELKIYPTQKITNQITLNVNKGIKNLAGYKLEENYSTDLQFTQVKPQVRLVNKNKKAILPGSSGLVLPFEAVGLSAVEVTIIRIFENNMLQYLQRNNLGDDIELHRVAKPIAKKIIPLNRGGVTNLNTWNRFTLNIEDIIKSKPGCVYQIKINFRKKHSLYFCGEDANIEEISSDLSEWDAEEESSYWDSYESYYDESYDWDSYESYYDGSYDWEERDNPCSESYYGNRRAVKKILFASNLGLIAKKGDGSKLSVFVTNILNTKTLSGVDIEIYNYQQQLIAQGTTDSQGKSIVTVQGSPYFLVAKYKDQIGYLKLDDGSSLSLSNFDVSGQKIQDGLKGFIYGERGVWRPADTLHLAFIIEDKVGSVPKKHPVIMELYNPQNQLFARKISSEPVGNIYRFDFNTSLDAPTGKWYVKAKVGGAEFRKSIKIETIKPNRLKIDLKFDKKLFDYNTRYATGNLNVRWLSGAKAANLKVEFEMLLSPIKTTFNGFPNFSFDDHSKDFYSSREMVYQGMIDASGFARVNMDLGITKNAPGALRAKFYGKIFEKGGDFSISTQSVSYNPYSHFVGLKVPEGDKRGIILTDKDHTIQIASVDAEGNPVSRKNVEIELFKLRWKWWWDNSYDNIANYLGRYQSRSIQKAKINTVNGKGKWILNLKYPNWGRYYLKVTDPSSGHSAGQVVYIDWPGWAGKGKRGELGGASMLDFSVENSEYNVGDKVKLSIPSTIGNRLLVSLETGSDIVQTFWVETDSGNTTLEFDATSDMAPNLYINLTMIQPHAQKNNDVPIRLYGIQYVKILDPSTLLKPVLKMPKELRPEQKFTVEISEENNRAMEYTLAIIDEGLLDITNYKTPDPWSAFNRREALGIKTWDVFDDVIGAYGGKLEHLLAIGGDDVIKQKEKSKVNRFKPVVIYKGPFSLESGKSKKHTITMPQYIGSVKTMVIASHKGAYGYADANTPVKQPLMVLATLPRVAGPGEMLKLPVNIFVLEDNIKNVSISVQTGGPLMLNDKKTKNISFKQAGDKIVFFNLKVDKKLGIGKVKVIATSGKIKSTYDIEMNIIPRNPMLTFIDDHLLDANEVLNLDYRPVGIEGTNKAALEISTLPSLNLENRLGYLIRFPHGCVEQTTSAVFAQLFLDKLVNLTDEQKSDIQYNVETGIKSLKTFQLSSGGFSYWPGKNEANLWGTNYAGHFLLEAKNMGYNVPESMLANWITFQTQKAEYWTENSKDENDIIQAYRLYTLAKVANPVLGAMNRMKEKTSLSSEAKWRLALAYSVAGYNDQALKIIYGLSSLPDTSSNNYSNTYGSYTRNMAMNLEALTTMDMRKEAFAILMEITKKMSDKNRWMSTQTTAYSFIAISKYIEHFKLNEQTSVNVNIEGKSQEIKGTDFIHMTTIHQSNKPKKIKVTNRNTTPVYLRLIRSGIPLHGSEKVESRNIKLDVTYTSLKGDVLDVTRLPQGTNFIAEVTIHNPGLKGKYNELALSQIFPSGWEIINTRLDESTFIQSKKIEYMDIRDDRVMHYFDLNPKEQIKLKILLNATYCGKFYLPSITIEAMYDNTIFANKKGKWVEIIKSN